MRCAVAFVVAASLLAIMPHGYGLGNPPSWPEENTRGHFPYHQLTEADFPVNDSAYPHFGMHTQGFLGFHYHDHWTTRNGHATARVMNWNVWSGFDRSKSSRKSAYKKVEETLPHEQGHLDISELYAKRFAEMPLDRLPVGEGATGKEAEADLARKMKVFAANFAAEAQREQDRYDAETNHGRNAAKQQEWSAEIHRRLQQAGIHF